MTLVDALRRRGVEEPERRAFSFDDLALSYAQLDSRARGVAAALQRRGRAGDRALLVYPPGLDFIVALFGCLYAGWIAVPTAGARLAQLEPVVCDAQPAVVLTTTRLQARVQSLGVPWLATDALPGGSADLWQERAPGADDLALLQYTSGSTASPRGVMLSHANLVHNTRQIERRFEIDPARSRGVIWLPPFHDMGLIGGILQGVASGFPIALMAPLTFLRRPAHWLEAITRERATISGAPNFAYDLCVERITPEERRNLDLSSWEVAFNGAEPVRPATLERFCETFAACGFRAEAFYPCYGLAEATLMVTGGAKSAAPSVVNGSVSCGSVIEDQQLAVVDGEIWVRGPSVARGYWRRDQLTREVFGAHLPSGEGPFLRTGDLGFVERGELYVTGRLEATLTVGGRTLHAEDVENTVAGSHGVGWPGGVAAVAMDDGGRERLVIVQEIAIGERAELHDVVHAIRLSVATRHQVPVSGVVLVRPGNIPRTSSGKVRRTACAELISRGDFDALREWRLA